MSAWVVPVNVENVERHDARRDAREQDRLEVRARLRVRRQVGERARVEDVQQSRQFGVGDAVHVVLVLGRWRRVPLVLLGERHEHLVEQRVAESRHLHVRPGVVAPSVIRIADAGLLSTRRRPHADARRSRRGLGGRHTAGGEVGDRHLDRDAVHVGGRQRVHAGRRTEGGQSERRVEIGDGTQVTQVEDRAEVDEERLGALSGEDHPAVATSGTPRHSRGPRSWASRAGRCCTAGTARSGPRPGRCRCRVTLVTE